jgi:hypothetical protein
MEALEDRGNSHSKRWPATRLGKYHELQFIKSQQDEAMDTAFKNTLNELTKRTEATKTAMYGKIEKLTRINSDVLVRKKKAPKEKKRKSVVAVAQERSLVAVALQLLNLMEKTLKMN